MNTGELDGLGRPILVGPRGGRYVLGVNGRKRTPARGRVAAALPSWAGTHNDLGREIVRGDRGWHVRDERGHMVPPVLARRPAGTPNAPRRPARPARPVGHTGPVARTLVMPDSPVAPEESREEMLERLRRECYNDDDPITLESLASLPTHELRNVVRVGSGRKKHCYSLESIFGVYKTGRNAGREPRDPLNSSHRLTANEVANINAKKLRRNAGYRPPRRHPGVIDPALEFHVSPTYVDGRLYYEITVYRYARGRWAPEMDLGVIPEVTIEDTGSAQDTTAVVLANLRTLFDNGRLLVRHGGEIGCCTVHLAKPMEYWDTNLVTKFLNMAREIRDAT